jgi:CheY-like chemotaxis protein
MRVVSVDGSISALRELQEAAKNGLRYEIGLIDMGMPDMDGFQLARAIRADPALADMKLVLLTSMLQRSQVSDVSSVGFNAFLVKPIHEAKLLECVQAVIANHRVDARKAPERLVTPESLSATARRQRPRVLLAEDNAVNRKVAVRMLERFGCNVDVAANGQEAVEACQGKTYALILMDCQMPDLDGLAATRMIREMENAKRTPIIALTAHALPGDRERCIEAGMDDHVPKPIKSEDLARALARWLPARCVEGSSPCS